MFFLARANDTFHLLLAGHTGLEGRASTPALWALTTLAVLTTACGDEQGARVSTAGSAGAAGAFASSTAGSGGAAGAPVDEPAWEPPRVAWPDPESNEPFLLSQTGLYRDPVRQDLAPDLIAFEPAHALWSDGSTKRRWVRIPKGTRIDTSDLDDWQLPVGTLLFKEFSRDGIRVETRVIARTGPERFDYWMGAFVWNETGTDAEFRPDGEENARGTSHDVPTRTQCGTCHNGEAGRALGFSALQLWPGGVLDALAGAGLLSHPHDPGEPPAVPGDAPVARALGYLHANCGHCHNPKGSARPDTNMNLRLDVGQTSPESTNAYLTTVGVELQYFDDTELVYRVAPGAPEQSALVERMRERGSQSQMPPFATELVHDDGVAWVTAWIRSLGE